MEHLLTLRRARFPLMSVAWFPHLAPSFRRREIDLPSNQWRFRLRSMVRELLHVFKNDGTCVCACLSHIACSCCCRHFRFFAPLAVLYFRIWSERQRTRCGGGGAVGHDDLDRRDIYMAWPIVRPRLQVLDVIHFNILNTLEYPWNDELLRSLGSLHEFLKLHTITVYKGRS